VFGFVQEWLILIIAVGAFSLEVYALVDAFRYSNEQFYAAGKRNKSFWTAMLGAAAAVGFLTLPPPLGRSGAGPLSLLGLAAVVIAGVYLADVRPALRQTGRGPTRRPQRGGW
jgi:hypothetical protein